MTVNALDAVYRTHVGHVREHNEDCLSVFADLGIMVLADGMGGHQAGEVASRIAVEAAEKDLLPAQHDDVADDLQSLMRVGQAVEAANRALLDAVAAKPDLQGMGTTLVAALFRESRIFHAHVGDSRLYRLRDGRLRRLTRDHSLLQELVDKGLFRNAEEAREAGIGDNILTRTLGLDPGVEIDMGDQHLEPGDIYLMCSDGLCGKVTDAELSATFDMGDDDLEVIADRLLRLALDCGGRDNISLILARPRV